MKTWTSYCWVLELSRKFNFTCLKIPGRKTADPLDDVIILHLRNVDTMITSPKVIKSMLLCTWHRHCDRVTNCERNIQSSAVFRDCILAIFKEIQGFKGYIYQAWLPKDILGYLNGYIIVPKLRKNGIKQRRHKAKTKVKSPFW